MCVRRVRLHNRQSTQRHAQRVLRHQGANARGEASEERRGAFQIALFFFKLPLPFRAFPFPSPLALALLLRVGGGEIRVGRGRGGGRGGGAGGAGGEGHHAEGEV